MTIPREIDWEIVIVDNRSTDDTKSLIQSYKDALPIRYVYESEQGHSVSRNAAIDAVTGDLVVWTDNDVIVSPQWISAYANGFRNHPQAAFFVGSPSV